MIVLFNPWSTPSPKKPLPMSLLAVGSLLEGEFDYCIIDGNIEADPIAKILAVEEKTRITAVAVTVMPGPQLKAAVELGRRTMAEPLSTGMRVTCSGDLFKHFHPALRDLKHELFKVVLLDAKNAVLKEATVSEGSLTLSIVHPREVFTLAVRESAASVIFLHNHPSGDPTPSLEDRQLTDRLVAAGRLLGIRVLDHLIVGDRRYVSFADEGWLKEEGA